MATFEEIAAKAEWEGGLDEALDWFKPEEVPEEIRTPWYRAKRAKKELDEYLSEIAAHLPED